MPIPKGKLGEFSKVEEEFEELKDSLNQDNPILALWEICDLVGAIKEYVQKKYNMPFASVMLHVDKISEMKKAA